MRPISIIGTSATPVASEDNPRACWRARLIRQGMSSDQGVEDGDGTTWLEPVTDEQSAAANQANPILQA